MLQWQYSRCDVFAKSLACCTNLLHVAWNSAAWFDYVCNGNLAYWALLLQTDLATTHCIESTSCVSACIPCNMCAMHTHKGACPLFKAGPAACNLACHDLKREYCNSSKVIALANHKARWRASEPIKTRRKHMKLTRSAENVWEPVTIGFGCTLSQSNSIESAKPINF